jgi:hypothetical protein
MAFDITAFRSHLKGDGARNTLFEVQLLNPIDGSADLVAPFMISAASLPSSILGVINVSYFGRRIKIPGDRTFQPWMIQVINDENFLVKNSLETWSNRINSLKGNLRDLPSSSYLEYISTAHITQLSKEGKRLRTYQFNNLWPSNIGEIAMSWEAQDQIEKFSVTFEYDYWDILPGATGNAGGR